jgi:hypothetical protein
MSQSTVNLILDVVLVVASIWMIWYVRGIGGIVGRTLNLIVIGAIILGVAHLLSTLTKDAVGPADSTVHRGVVLLGFVFLVIGFRQLRTMK